MASKAEAVWCFFATLLGDEHCGHAWNWPKAHLAKTEMSVQTFAVDCARLPHSIDELYGVIGPAPGCTGPWLKRSDYRGFGMTVYYWKNEADGTFQLRLLGRDGAFGSADDVTVDPEPHVWGGMLIEEHQRRWLIGFLALLSANPLLRRWRLGRRS